MRPVPIVKADARNIHPKHALFNVTDAVFVVVARQHLFSPEEEIRPEHYAKDAAQQQHGFELRGYPPKSPDGQCFYRAQYIAGEIHRQIFLHPPFPDLCRFRREGQCLFHQHFHLAGRDGRFFQPPPLQQFCHRDAQQFGQRQQQRNVRHTQAPLPFTDCLVRDIQLLGQVLLRPALFPPQLRQERPERLLV